MEGREDARGGGPPVVRIRKFTSSDYQGVCRLFNSNWPEYSMSAEELKHEDTVITKNGYFLRRYVAVGPGGRIVGYGDISERVERYKPGKLHLSIEVEAKLRGGRTWTRLYGRLVRAAKARNARLFTAVASEADKELTTSLRREGFAEVSANIESGLDLRRLDRRSLEKAAAGLEDGEVAFTTLGSEKVSNPNLAKNLYEMEYKARRSIPTTDRWRRMRLSEYIDLVHSSPRIVDDGWFIAKKGKNYIGESYLMKSEGYPTFLSTGFTCVVPEFRRRGIATSLKLRGLLWAKKQGVPTVRTWNDSQNKAMLSLNRKLGFRKRVAWIRFEKKMSGRQ